MAFIPSKVMVCVPSTFSKPPRDANTLIQSAPAFTRSSTSVRMAATSGGASWRAEIPGPETNIRGPIIAPVLVSSRMAKSVSADAFKSRIVVTPVSSVRRALSWARNTVTAGSRRCPRGRVPGTRSQ
jgi:hypothetical protein